MKKVVKAKIQWLKPDEGGRKTPLGHGFRYYPLVEFENFTDTDCSWSADMIWHDQLDDALTTIADFSFLVEEAPFHLLKSGNKFNLFEGKRLVAIGYIL
jgi:hypothetical protein